jgi:chromate reductase, NAD(P)H dehydrogenase (quinone)
VKVLAICGSLRSDSSNAALLRAARALAPPGMEIVAYDGLGDLPHFNPDLDGEGQPAPPAVARLRSLISDSEGLVISSPEYAHGVPGSLKNALDWLVSYPDFAGKPVLLLNASAAGGEWAQRSLVETLTTMSARVASCSLRAPFLRRKLDARGTLSDRDAERVLAATLASFAVAIRGPRPGGH